MKLGPGPIKMAAASILPDSEATREAGRAFGSGLEAPARVLLLGELGAGKTTFVTGVVEGLGIAAEVTSPTFTLIQEYGADASRVFHVDLYRIEDSADLVELGFWEIWEGPDIILVEWGERLPEEAAAEATHVIRLSLDGDGRRLEIDASEPTAT